MKVFILAIDGLEYNLVEKWDLKNLKQTVYGKGKSFITRDVPYTPTMWTSFITGKYPEEHKINTWWTWGIFEHFKKLPIISKIRGKGKFLKLFGINPRRLVKRTDWKVNIETIFDKIRPSIPLFIPAYNESEKFHQFEKELNIFDLIRKRGNEKMPIETLEEIILKNHQKRKEIMFEEIEKDWKLFMVWFDLCDLFGHVFWTINFPKIRWAYYEFDSLVKKIKEKIKDKYLFLIVSDHGMELSEDGVTGNHSDHFFWSLNIKTDWRPKDFTSFFDFIIENAKKEV